jgi:hypothetical protein
MSVCPSTCPHGKSHLPRGRGTEEILIKFDMGISRKSVQKIQIKGTLHEDQYTFFIISRSILLKWKTCQMKYYSSLVSSNFREKNSIQASHLSCIKLKTLIVCSITFFENRAVYEIMWEIYRRAGQATDDSMAWHMLIACCIPKARHTLRICNTYRFPNATTVTPTRLNVTLYV